MLITVSIDEKAGRLEVPVSGYPALLILNNFVPVVDMQRNCRLLAKVTKKYIVSLGELPGHRPIVYYLSLMKVHQGSRLRAKCETMSQKRYILKRSLFGRGNYTPYVNCQQDITLLEHLGSYAIIPNRASRCHFLAFYRHFLPLNGPPVAPLGTVNYTL